MGLSRWLQQRHGAELWMSAIGHGSTERLLRHGGDPDTRELGFAFLAAHGLELSADGRARVEASDPARWYGELPELGRALQDGDRVVTDGREWQVIETAGHCRGHLCLYDARAEILISGDQVLPTISPNVSVLASRPEADTLGEFLASLERLDRACAPETLFLPSQGRAFRGLHERIEVVRSHHLEQLEALREACRTPRCAHELLPVMYGRPLRGFHRFLALGETVAHLNHLWHAGELLRTVDAAGRIRFGAR
ncbi:MAG: MBL fold metallo-hydrolase, partial [Steroidobacteraceae bacterium]